jgi:hypothetical protein
MSYMTPDYRLACLPNASNRRTCEWEIIPVGTTIQAVLDDNGTPIHTGLSMLIKLGDGRYGSIHASDYQDATRTLEEDQARFRAEREAQQREEEERRKPPVLLASPPRQSLSSSITPNSQPEAVAKLVWEAILTNCHWTDEKGRVADSYFYNDDSGLHDFRDATFSKYVPKPISSAEKLNGLKAAGYVSVLAQVSRKMDRPNSRDGHGVWANFSNGGGITIKFANWNGHWYFLKDPFFAQRDEVLDEETFHAFWRYDPEEAASHRVPCAVATAPDPFSVGRSK